MSLKQEDIKQLIAILQRGLSSDSDESEDDVDEQPIKNTKKITTLSNITVGNDMKYTKGCVLVSV